MTFGRSIRWIVWSLALGCGADDIAESEAERGDAAAPSHSQEPLVKLEPPDQGVQLVTNGLRIGAGADEEWCEVVVLPGSASETFFVGRTELAMTRFSHHLLVSIAPHDSPSLLGVEPGIPEVCSGTHHYGNDLLPIAGSSRPYQDHTYPDGVGVEVRGGQRLLFNYHVFNTGDVSYAVQHRLNLHFVDEVDKRARVFGFYNQYIEIPPQTARSFGDECRFKNDLLVWSIRRHTHRLGTDFRVSWAGGDRDGESIWTSRDWELEVRHDFDSPVVMRAGTGFRWECDFQNPTDQPVISGPQATDEMCILFGDFAALGDDAEVGPQSCYRFMPPP